MVDAAYIVVHAGAMAGCSAGHRIRVPAGDLGPPMAACQGPCALDPVRGLKAIPGGTGLYQGTASAALKRRIDGRVLTPVRCLSFPKYPFFDHQTLPMIDSFRLMFP